MRRAKFVLLGGGVFVLLVALILLGLTLAGRSPFRRPSLPPTVTPLAELEITPLLAPERDEQLAQTGTPPRPTTPPSPITLTLWLPEFLSPAQESAGGRILKEQYEAFTKANRHIIIEHKLKKPHGKGGIRDFLLTTQAVIPSALPDIVALDLSELEKLVEEGLLQPLDELLPEELEDDLFLFARQAATFNDRLMALPFEADLEHLIYNREKITFPPRSWTELLTTEDATYVFPAGGDQGRVNLSFLIQYLALGGHLRDDEGHPTIDEAKVAQTLRFYREARPGGVVPYTISELETLDDCWPRYLAAEATMANVDSHRYMAEGDVLKKTSFSSIPTRDGNTATIARGWAYAIVIQEPARQAAAASFIRWLTMPENLAKWAQSANHLPTHRSAFHLQGMTGQYMAFLESQLEAAYPPPSLRGYEKIGQALQTAVEQVLSRRATPDEAARQAAASLER